MLDGHAGPGDAVALRRRRPDPWPSASHDGSIRLCAHHLLNLGIIDRLTARRLPIALSRRAPSQQKNNARTGIIQPVARVLIPGYDEK